MTPRKLTRALAVAASLALALGLSGCGAEGLVSQYFPVLVPPEKEVAAPPEPSPTPVAPEAIVLPACDELMPIENFHELTGSKNFVPWHPPGESRRTGHSWALGPLAEQALMDAEQVRSCVWTVTNTDSGVSVLLAELTDDERDNLMLALDDSFFTRSDEGDGVLYSLYQKETFAPSYRSYMFTGNLWVIEFGHWEDAPLAHEVTAAAIAANPNAAW